MKKQPIKKQRKMYIGWLHQSSNDSRFKQVQMKDRGGVRDYTHNDDNHITVDFLKADAKKIIFSGGNVQARCRGKMHFDLGNFAQERISQFTDVNGNRCTFQEYLRSQGLFAS